MTEQKTEKTEHQIDTIFPIVAELVEKIDKSSPEIYALSLLQILNALTMNMAAWYRVLDPKDRLAQTLSKANGGAAIATISLNEIFEGRFRNGNEQFEHPAPGPESPAFEKPLETS